MVMADVPADGPVRLGSVQLPEGRQLSDWDDDAPLLWATTEPAPAAGSVWRALTDLHRDTGLVPILLAFLGEGHEGRPWDEREFDEECDPALADGLDAGAVLAEVWPSSASDPDDLDPAWVAEFAPYGPGFPGLAPAPDRPLTGAGLAAALGWFGPARIGLVPASRPADVLCLVGYNGTVNPYRTPVKLVAVVRSWEDRFGAVLVQVGFAHIRLLARRPPRTVPDALAVAAELWTMCDEFWTIGNPETAVDSIQDIAEYILDIPIWSLWLD